MDNIVRYVLATESHMRFVKHFRESDQHWINSLFSSHIFHILKIGDHLPFKEGSHVKLQKGSPKFTWKNCILYCHITTVVYSLPNVKPFRRSKCKPTKMFFFLK